MPQRQDAQQDLTAGWSEQHTRADRPELVGSEDLHLRNYDRQWGYDISLEVVGEDGEDVYEQSYYLQPGQVVSERDVLPAGEYEVRATMDNLRETALECRIDADPEHTVVIEVGNGALSLTEGMAD